MLNLRCLWYIYMDNTPKRPVQEMQIHNNFTHSVGLL